MGSGKGKKAEDKLAPQDKLQIEMSIWNNKYLSMLALKTETKSSCLQRRKRLRNKRQRGFPDGASGKEPACQCRRDKRPGFDPWVRKNPWRRERQPTPFLPGGSHEQRSLAGYSP